MQGFAFTTDPSEVLDALAQTLMNPGPGYTCTTHEPDCLNLPEVVKGINSCLKLAIQYGWYLHLTEADREKGIKEVEFVFVQIPWETEPNAYSRLYLGISPQGIMVIDVNCFFNASMRKAGIIVRKKNQPPPSCLEKMGLNQVKFPEGLQIASGVIPSVLGTSKFSDMAFYSITRLKIPKVKTEDLPLYLHTNPIVKADINLENRLKAGVKKSDL